MANLKNNRYLKLFTSTFKLSACTFGGGFVIIPLMRKKFVQELEWIEEQEMLDLTAIAQSSPGAIAVNASILVGYHVAGVLGALVTVVGTVLPPLIIISIISLFYKAFRDNPIVSMAMAGMLCGVAAVIFDVVIDMAKVVFKKKRLLPLLVLIGAFIAVRFYAVNILIIILVCGVIGAIDTVVHEKKGAEVK
ncbi:MAG: chromate transporter [Erysipelotrichaceae bacterium]|nr:chromate transporter [Erysipelotrichaceae bacterium]